MANLPFYLEDMDPTAYERLPWTAMDLETTNIGYGDPRIKENRIVMAAFCEDGAEPTCVNDPAQLVYEAFPEFTYHPQVLVAHNAKFELGWMLRHGIDLSNILVWDTMIAEYVIAGNQRVALDLGSVAARYGLPTKEPFIDALMNGGVCPSEMPEHLLEARVRRDTQVAGALFKAQLARMKELGLLPVMFTRCIVTPVLAAIEREGMCLDERRVYEETLRVNKELQEVRSTLDEMLDGRNPRSGKQLGEFLYDVLKFDELRDRKGNPIRTAAGARCTDKQTLEALVARTPEQKRFVEARSAFGKLDAALTKSLNFFSGICSEYGSTFCGNFNQTVTKTHRLSSSGRKVRFRDGTEKGVQFQNLPREYKRLFCASGPGRKLVEADGAQLEFRVAAYLGQDPVAVQDIVTGFDVHTFTASIINGIDESAVTKRQRTAAKAHTFKPLFGGASGTKKEKAYYEAFKQKYAKIAATQEGWRDEVLRTKQLRMPWGLRAYWPGCKMTSSGYIEHTTEIYNLPIQSFATADIIPVSLVYSYWLAQDLDVRIINTVHDSLVADVHEDDLERFRDVLHDAFLRRTYVYLERVYGMEMNVPLGLGINVADHWGEGKEETYSEPYKTVLGIDKPE